MSGASIRWVVLAGLVGVTGCDRRPGPTTVPAQTEPSETTPEPAESEVRATSSQQSGQFEVGGCDFTIVYDNREPGPMKAAFERWVFDSAKMVATYYGGEFPVPDLRITLALRSGRGVGFGQHWDGRRIKVRVGGRTDPAELATDWVMVHEMFHATFPDLEDRHRWMQEGLSTYLEAVARVRDNRTSPEQLWGRWSKSMRHGVPASGDRGLDNTRTWGALYWGGALFWLIADVEIRRETNNERGLEDALRGIVAEGGNGRANWSTAKVVEVGDRATGTTVLRRLYDSMATQRGDVDLDHLWAELGVVDGGRRLDDDAALAHVRRGISGSP